MKSSPRKKRIVKPMYERCPFCQEKKVPDYKEADLLSPFLTERARIIPSTRSGVCSKHQRQLSTQIKRARYLAVLPFVEEV